MFGILIEEGDSKAPRMSFITEYGIIKIVLTTHFTAPDMEHSQGYEPWVYLCLRCLHCRDEGDTVKYFCWEQLIKHCPPGIWSHIGISAAGTNFGILTAAIIHLILDAAFAPCL